MSRNLTGSSGGEQNKWPNHGSNIHPSIPNVKTLELKQDPSSVCRAFIVVFFLPFEIILLLSVFHSNIFLTTFPLLCVRKFIPLHLSAREMSSAGTTLPRLVSEGDVLTCRHIFVVTSAAAAALALSFQLLRVARQLQNCHVEVVNTEQQEFLLRAPQS